MRRDATRKGGNLMRSRFGVIALTAGLVLSGCGGGGGGSSSGTNPPPTAPTVTSVTPANGATAVPVNSAVTAKFSQAMNAATLTSSTFTLTAQGGSAVSGSVSYNATSLTATFTPAANLAFNTQYTAAITTGAMNSSGTALSGSYTWSFTTAAAPAPTVTAVTPLDNATGVAVTSALTATFSEAMDSATINTSTFTVTGPGGAVSGTVSYSTSNNTATFTLNGNLTYGAQYTATITTGATASNGTPLATNYSWSFTTQAAPALAVTATTPLSGATGISITSAVTATFNQTMNAATLTAATFTLTAQGGGSVAGIVSYNSGTSTATFTPSSSLASNITYTATITTGAAALSGATLAANYAWSFTTAASTTLSVTSTTPAGGATNVDVTKAITATFSQPMNALTLTTSTFNLTGPNGNVSGTVSYSGATSTATFTPSSNLAYNTSYTATITTGAQDTSGVSLTVNYVWNFTTQAPPNNPTTVDFGTTYQTIRGFGGSTAWLGQLTTQQATALFDPTNGLGLNILRVRIDPTGSSGSNWVTTNWTTERTNALEAQQANSNAIVFASPWTPPPKMKTSSSTQPYYSGTAPCSPGPYYCGGYLDPASYAAYAGYLEDFVTYFANGGVNLYAISMQNEPDYSAQPNQNYESCSWTATQMDTWIANNASVLTTKLMMPESYNFNKAMSDPSLQDPNAVNLISIIGEHLYGVSNPLPNYSSAQALGKEVWMTEHALTPAGAQPTITDALALAQEVNNSLTTGGYNAYVWWWIWNNPSLNINYGLINSNTTSPAPTYYGYAIGQFSKFIKAGYVRASATANPAPNVYVSAYKGNGHYVIVAINTGTAAPILDFTLNNSNINSLTPYETTGSGGLMQQLAVSVSNGQFTYTLPAQSITTFFQ